MNYSSIIKSFKSLCRASLAIFLACQAWSAAAQNCPASIPSSISANPDTYYPGINSNLAAGSTSITLGAAGYGTVPIATGDMLLIIQMQGAQINSANTTSYGDGVAGGPGGYYSNAALMAGNMEYLVATNAVPLTGGTLTLLNATTKNYKNADYSTDGQYRFQVIRVGLYYSLTLSGSFSAPAWNGSTGGVLALNVTNDLNFNGQTISAAAAGFRGGGARQLSGGSGGLNTDLVSVSTNNFNGSKGEGIAGTPRFVNNNGTLYDNGVTLEGYPNGSSAAGAPGNAGGGGTDGRPSNNDQNSGGGGGANGGNGGKGGNSWSSNLSTGGEAGGRFLEYSPSRMVMGGGGGAGTTNDGTGTPGSGFASSGAAGGGIVIINAGSISGTGIIDVTGANSNTSVKNDGNGGGGAGGSVLIYANSGQGGITVLANGGTGGSNIGGGSPPPHGPGGGGGGGVVFCNAALNAASSVAGGTAGLTTGSISYGSINGADGILVQNITTAAVPPQFMNCSVLPVRFKNVTAKWVQEEVVISWQVTNEASVKNYVVEKSTDGSNFTEAGSVAYRYSPNGENEYHFTDLKNNKVSSVTYYRVKEVSSQGAILYSMVIAIRVQEDLSDGTFIITPNPATGANASLRFTSNKQVPGIINLRMLSVNGVSVWQKQYRVTEGLNVVPIENLTSIPNGLYFIQYVNGGVVENLKMIVRH